MDFYALLANGDVCSRRAGPATRIVVAMPRRLRKVPNRVHSRRPPRPGCHSPQPALDGLKRAVNGHAEFLAIFGFPPFCQHLARRLWREPGGFAEWLLRPFRRVYFQ